MNPTLTKVQPIQYYKHGYVIETHDEITNFYIALPHISINTLGPLIAHSTPEWEVTLTVPIWPCEY